MDPGLLIGAAGVAVVTIALGVVAWRVFRAAVKAALLAVLVPVILMLGAAVAWVALDHSR